jgi:hypothetical protein
MLPVAVGRKPSDGVGQVWAGLAAERRRDTTIRTWSTEEGDIEMGIGVSLFLLAVGAVLAFAVHVTNSGGFDINTIGVILMVVGAVGIIISLVFWSSWGGFGHRDLDDDVVVRDSRVVR